MKINLPRDVEYIIDTLERAGYEAYAVGGCVRDALLHREPQDWDITTSAKPRQIKALFRTTIDTGIAHGTVTVLLKHVGYEVTTYRIDGEYEDHRHPKNVEFTENLVQDLQRRDFTINAMAYHCERGLVDAFSGMEDLKKGVIRCVGDAGARFDEDALRMLRAVRFAGQLGFSIEEETYRAILTRASRLQSISAERIRVELTKLLTAKDAGQIRTAYASGMTRYFLPELDRMLETEQHNRHHIYTVGEHCIHSVEVMNFLLGRSARAWDAQEVPAEVQAFAKKVRGTLSPKQESILCVAMLLHDVGKPDTMTRDENGAGHFYGHQKEGARMAGEILRRLTFDNETVAAVKHLIYWHDYQYGETEGAMRRAVSKIGREAMPLLFLVQFSDILSQNPDTFDQKLEKMYRAIDLWERVQDSGAALTVKELAVSGHDLIAAGWQPGPALGALLKQALEYVLAEPEKNQKDFLIDYLRKQTESM